MRFAHPWLLLLALLAPLLVYLRHARRRGAAAQFSDGALLARLPVAWTVRAQWALPALYCLGLLGLVAAIARPQRGLAESRVRTEAVDIVLAVDVSGSMDTPDFATANRAATRIDAARGVLKTFIGKRPNDRIGMIAFATMPYTVSPLTLDHAWLLQRLEAVNTALIDNRSTAIGDAIASAVNRLRDSQAKSKVIVLLTDGQNNAGQIMPEQAAQAARALGFRIYCIGAGNGDPEMNFFNQIVGFREIDFSTLQHIADITGGRFFRAKNSADLQKIYRDIDAMEKTEIEVEHYTRFEERFQPFLLAALLLLGLERLLALTRLGRWPA